MEHETSDWIDRVQELQMQGNDFDSFSQPDFASASSSNSSFSKFPSKGHHNSMPSTIEISSEMHSMKTGLLGDKEHFASTISQLTGSPLMVSKLKLLNNGSETFPTIIDALKSAKKYIHFQYFIFRNDQIGSQAIQILTEKARSGTCQVRVLLDAVGSLFLSAETIDELVEAGVHVAIFSELRFPKGIFTSRVNRRNHRKIVVIDGEVGFCGGLNFADEYKALGDEEGIPFWRDVHLKMAGRAVSMLQKIFMDDWRAATGHDLSTIKVLDPGDPEASQYRALLSDPRLPRSFTTEQRSGFARRLSQKILQHIRRGGSLRKQFNVNVVRSATGGKQLASGSVESMVQEQLPKPEPKLPATTAAATAAAIGAAASASAKQFLERRSRRGLGTSDELPPSLQVRTQPLLADANIASPADSFASDSCLAMHSPFTAKIPRSASGSNLTAAQFSLRNAPRVVKRRNFANIAKQEMMTGQIAGPSQFAAESLRIRSEMIEAPVQVVAGGPDSHWCLTHKLFFAAMTQAKKSIWISTAYLIPDSALLTAIKTAALSGIDVRIITQGVIELYMTHFATKAFLKELTDAGVRVFLYQAGILHSKTIAIDSEVSLVGSANIDFRSCKSNYELTTVIYSKDFTALLEDDFQKDCADSEEVTRDQLSKVSFASRMISEFVAMWRSWL